MPKPAFDPSQPFEVASKPKFDPTQAFDKAPAGGQQEPGVQAIGNPDGPTTPTQKVVSAGTKGVQAVGKLSDILRGTLTGPPLAMALGAASGKEVFKPGEVLDAVNPTNLKKFPGANELFARAGVPEGGKLSDVVQSPLSVLPGGLARRLAPLKMFQYQEPGKSEHWYQPEKGGMLDPTIRGTGGVATDIAIDPATWLSLGAGGLRRAAMEANPTVQALKESAGPVAKAVDSVGAPVQKVIDAATLPAELATQAVQKVPIAGNAAVNLATAPSSMISSLGKKIYSSVLHPVEAQGEKFGKADVADTFYNAGIASPFSLRDQAGSVTSRLMNARNKMLGMAGEQGATIPMSEATQSAREQVAKLREIGDQTADKLADELESNLNYYSVRESGTPATPGKPATTRQVPSALTDEFGKPIMKLEDVAAIPGTPGTPPKPYTPQGASDLKSFIYNQMPGNFWNELGKSSEGAAAKGKLSMGIKNAIEKTMESKLGPGAGSKIKSLNKDAGVMLSTRPAQQTVGNQANRLLYRTFSPTGSDAALMSISGSYGGPWDAAKTLAIKHGLDALRLGTMPAGYGVRALGEGELTGPALDIFLRQKAIQKANQIQESGQ